MASFKLNEAKLLTLENKVVVLTGKLLAIPEMKHPLMTFRWSKLNRSCNGEAP